MMWYVGTCDVVHGCRHCLLMLGKVVRVCNSSTFCNFVISGIVVCFLHQIILVKYAHDMKHCGPEFL